MRADEDVPYFLGGPPESAVADPGTRPPEPPRDPRVPGEAGLWVFLLGDMTLFGAFFAGFLVYRRAEPEVFRDSASALAAGLGAFNTVILLTSSLLMAAAIQAQRSGRDLRRMRRLLGGVLVCAAIFALIKISEYVHLLGEGHSPQSNVFFTLYFALTGIHLLHLLVGGGVVTALLRVLSASSDPWSRTAFARGVASYWHMVDLLWVVLFPLLYLVPTS